MNTQSYFISFYFILYYFILFYFICFYTEWEMKQIIYGIYYDDKDMNYYLCNKNPTPQFKSKCIQNINQNINEQHTKQATPVKQIHPNILQGALQKVDINDGLTTSLRIKKTESKLFKKLNKSAFLLNTEKIKIKNQMHSNNFCMNDDDPLEYEAAQTIYRDELSRKLDEQKNYKQIIYIHDKLHNFFNEPVRTARVIWKELLEDTFKCSMSMIICAYNKIYCQSNQKYPHFPCHIYYSKIHHIFLIKHVFCFYCSTLCLTKNRISAQCKICDHIICIVCVSKFQNNTCQLHQNI